MVKVRFAPSPTGYLHIGNTRTLLINYLFSRANKGSLVLRIEDTDIERSDARYEASIIEDLHWLGIACDEGPIRQSDRLNIYLDYAKILLEKNAAYKCFCTIKDLEQMRENSLKKGEPPKYNGTCRHLSPDMVKSMEQEGRPYVVRFKSLEKQIIFIDDIHGRIDFPRDHVDDFILLKQEHTPSYNFAATVDDMLMGITHVIRGADHISNTPKQIMLFEVLGHEPPQYAHHSLLTGDDKKPLSKRHGVTNIREFRNTGILPTALMNYVGIIGRNVKKELMDMEELVETFSLNSLSSSDSVFDMDKLLWFNKEYIRNTSAELLLKDTGLPPDLKEKVLLLRENARTLNEIKDLLNIFDGSDIDEEGIAYLKAQKDIHAIIEAIDAVFKSDRSITFERLIHELQDTTNIKKRDMFMALRIIFTGRKSGPPLGEIFHLIPKETIIKRINSSISLIP
ncbi:MAG: glutamate--tRNA ligase [Proteobacteria bacterium]|nr:glutamate--tRNA ligase [Pseudomonadota bacterium]